MLSVLMRTEMRAKGVPGTLFLLLMPLLLIQNSHGYAKNASVRCLCHPETHKILIDTKMFPTVCFGNQEFQEKP